MRNGPLKSGPLVPSDGPHQAEGEDVEGLEVPLPQEPKKLSPHPRLQDPPAQKKTPKNTQDNRESPGGRNGGVGICLFGLLVPHLLRVRPAPHLLSIVVISVTIITSITSVSSYY